ncbi:aldo/keto reductase [Subdoligranulum variabile]|uniref:aldo/keto reductase n=1 Tax=Subdoligranulum variabile TaxID=214851 RepID=UPI0029434D3A|nr:aldo/keto reductase [Subdoligranulum variabile]
MKYFTTADGSAVGRIGQGTWYLGENPAIRDDECAALQAGMEAGMNLLDTAEMYGEGAAETLVGQAIRGRDREKLFLVSKVYPFNAGRQSIFTSCENSLRRMKTDYLDLYLLHWRGRVPLAETVECMEELKAQGKIRAWGVSNLDTDDMQELFAVPRGQNCAANQVLYHLGSRGIEYDLLPLMRRQGVPVMAYCPLAQAGRLRRGLLSSPAVRQIAQNHGVSPTQVLLAFVLAHNGVLPIPRSGQAHHTLQNAAAADIRLTESELAALDRAFPAPAYKTPLDIV